MPSVMLLCHTPMPEKTIAAAARLCYSHSGADELFDGMTDERARSYVEMLERLGHESPLEHASFTFGIEGVSRAFLAQMTRHRIASFSVQSQRYVRMEDFNFITPPNVAEDEEALAEYNRIMQTCAESYGRLAAILQKNAAAKLVEEGKLSAGHARALVPLSPSLQESAANAIVSGGLSVRQTEALVKRLSAEKKEAQAKDPDEVDYLAEAQNELKARLCRGVKIVPGRKKGRIELEYYGVDDLNDLLDALAVIKVSQLKKGPHA